MAFSIHRSGERREAPRRARCASFFAVLFSLAAASTAGAQTTSLPFAPGEELVYQIRSSRFGNVGTGSMRVAGPEDVRGTETYSLHFDFTTRIMLFTVEDRTRSWIDPSTMASLRYHKYEKNPLSSATEEVEIHPAEQRWLNADGTEGRSLTTEPLDELSFLYFLRTLPLVDGEVREVERHFDPARNPVVVRVVGRETLEASIGDFATVIVEMQVNDAGRFGGRGTLRLHLTDDERRLPVRIETSVPIAGSLVLDLVQATFPARQ